MKLKRLPEDFQVEERSGLRPTGGPFALYRLTKRSLGTPEAIDAIARQWNLPRPSIAFAGLKDRHALTTQYVTIQDGPRRGLKQQLILLEYLGQASRAVESRDIEGNAFVVVVRDVTTDEVAFAQQELARVARDGLPNYFDNQRFGSLGESGEFIAKPWCLGNYERALWLALADENAHDRPDQREQKQILREWWGSWSVCKAKLARTEIGEIAARLNERLDYRQALAQVRQDLRSIWLAAFQSHLWNQMLAALIRETCPSSPFTTEQICRRDVPFFLTLSDDERMALHSARLPLPSARLHLEDSPMKQLIDRVMAEEGLALREMRIKYPRDSFFSKGERAAVFLPNEVTHETGADELYPGRHKLTLRFTLPRGSYATTLVKRIAGGSLEEPAPMDG